MSVPPASTNKALTPAQILARWANASGLSVVSLASPTELNAIAGGYKSELRVCYQTIAGADNFTVYSWDDADSAAANSPYTVAGSSGRWIAIAGRYVNSAASINGNLAAPLALLAGAADNTFDKLQVLGSALVQGFATAVVSKTAAYTATNADYTINCDATSAAFAIALPTTGIATGKKFLIRKTDITANAITLTGTVDGVVNPIISNRYGKRLIEWNGTNYHTVTQNLGAQRLIGSLRAANFNVTTDQAIAIDCSKYVLRKITVDNASISLTTAAGGFYSGAAKTGTIFVAAAQAYSALTAATKFIDATLAAICTTDIQTAATIYLSLTTAQGAAATADIYLWGDDLT